MTGPAHRLRFALTAAIAFGLVGVSPLAVHAAPGEKSQVSAQQASKKKRARRAKKKRREKKEPADAEAAPTEEAAQAEGSDSSAASDAGASKTHTTAATGTLRRSNKMEFDARLIRGETAGSGAVILFDRGQRRLPPLTKKRTRFLDATLQEVYGARSRKLDD